MGVGAIMIYSTNNDGRTCALCHQPIARQPWVLLNRYGIGTGDCRGMCEILDPRGQYFWDVGEDLDATPEVASGAVLCFPACLNLYIEGKMVAADIAIGHTK